jgi:hypothetical protein
MLYPIERSSGIAKGRGCHDDIFIPPPAEMSALLMSFELALFEGVHINYYGRHCVGSEMNSGHHDVIRTHPINES